jgi:hypothetical protein
VAGKLQEPEKELRFTRSGQAVGFWLVAAVCAAIAVTLVATAFYRDINPHLPHPVWAILPLVLAVVLVRTAMRMTRHAYLILTPMGIEIFPFFRPEKGMQMLLWQEIDHAEISRSGGRLTLHRDVEETSGIHLSLRPIRRDRRDHLTRAIQGRLAR